MLKQEADWLNGVLSRFEAAELSPVAHIGSSTAQFRTQTQPWIDQKVFAPLTARGVAVVHVDLKSSAGVDLVADVTTPAGCALIRARQPRAVFLFNILEHVLDPATLCAAIEEVLPDQGLILITVPRSYPYHRDPIDTMYRPAPDEVAALFGSSRLIKGEILHAGSLRQQVMSRPIKIVSLILKALLPLSGFEKWMRAIQKLKWLFVDYKVTCVVLRKSTPAAPAQ